MVECEGEEVMEALGRKSCFWLGSSRKLKLIEEGTMVGAGIEGREGRGPEASMPAAAEVVEAIEVAAMGRG